MFHAPERIGQRSSLGNCGGDRLRCVARELERIKRGASQAAVAASSSSERTPHADRAVIDAVEF
jgi:hypothetical protein